MKLPIIATGKRKRAIARAVLKEGSGKIRINKKPLELFARYVRMCISEPLILAGEVAKIVDIDVNVKGGGVWSQAYATRTAIANALVQYKKALKEVFLNYDRSLLVSDPRRTEPHKPSRSSKGPRRKKQQSKR